MSLSFLKCNKCGSVIVKAFDNCKEDACEDASKEGGIVELVAGAVDAAKEKHVPCVSVSGNCVCVKVGSVLHPMEEKHLITFIALETNKGFQVKTLKSGDAPEASFLLCDGEKAVCAYEYCNLHGLWKKDI